MTSTPRPRIGLKRSAVGFVVFVAIAALALTAIVPAAGATAYVPISGAGSSWSANALTQWATNVQQDGMRVSFASIGSTAGREQWLAGQYDFAASDIPFQTDPTDGSAPENPPVGGYAYMPITAGGTVFMYNLTIDGQRVTNLRLSGQNFAKIFTDVITNWDDPAIAADNPGLKLPSQTIVPVVRSDGAGSSYFLSQWMISQYPSIWNAFCTKSGRAPACGPTSNYPTVSGSSMISQNGDLGVSSYVSQNYASGSIGYVNYSYALADKFPVAQMLNAAGYYTEPTAQNVAVSLLQDKVDTTDVNNPALYLTQNLSGVYADPDPRTYPLSEYGYLILPAKALNGFTTAKGATLAAFSYYSMCQGQQYSAALGYSPMPINLVQAGFAQIAKIPGASVQSINIANCNNPTFSTTGVNLLAQTAPNPPACDKQGPIQCVNGTGGAIVATAVSAGSAESKNPAAVAAATAGSTGGSGTTGATQSGAAATGAGPSSKSSTSSIPVGSASCASQSTSCDSTAGTGDLSPTAATQTLPVSGGWSTTQTLMVLIILLVLALILVPGLVSRRARRAGP
jgi:phosphate ABC transporter phosphate-binding protein